MTKNNPIMSIGKHVSHYEILEPLGKGGMGEIFRAEDTKLHRCVALKFLPEEFGADPIAKKRFLREARAASLLDHPNICNIHEVDETENGQLFICMTAYEGETLDKKLHRGPLELTEVIRIATQILEGLSKAHRAGIIHRDIKPANILITNEGVVKILDFGLAKLSSSRRLTQTGASLGTPGYMSPEQIRGKDIDQRTDIWSFGVVLYEMLANEMPFTGEYEQAVVYAIMNKEPPDFGEFCQEIPSFLKKMCVQCLQKEKELRPNTAGDLLKLIRKESPEAVIFPRTFPGRTYLTRPVLIGVSLTIVAVISVILYLMLAPGPSPSDRWNVGILPFYNRPGANADHSLSKTIPYIILENILGVQGLGIVDLLEYRSSDFQLPPDEHLYSKLRSYDIDFVIEGSIEEYDSLTIISSQVKNIKTFEVLCFQYDTLRSGDSRGQIAAGIALNILNFFKVSILAYGVRKDIRPWLGQDVQKTNVDAVQAFLNASEEIYRGEQNNVKEYLKRAITLDSTFISPRVWLTVRLWGEGNKEEAIKNYNSLKTLGLNASPFEKQIIYYAGAYMDGNRIEQENYLKNALEYSPRNNILLLNVAVLQYMRGDYLTSIETLEQINDVDKNFESQVYYMLGLNYCQLKSYNKAKKILLENLRSDDIYEPVYGLLSGICLKEQDLNNYQSYRQQYIISSRLKKKSFGRIFFDLADFYNLFGMTDQAISDYKNAIKHNSSIPKYHENLADLYLSTRDTGAAITEWRSVIEIDSNYAPAYANLGEIFDRMNDSTRAIRYYTRFLTLDSMSLNYMKVYNRLQKLKITK